MQVTEQLPSWDQLHFDPPKALESVNILDPNAYIFKPRQRILCLPVYLVFRSPSERARQKHKKALRNLLQKELHRKNCWIRGFAS